MSIKLTLNLPKNPYEKNDFLGDGSTINELLEEICIKFPKLKKYLFIEKGVLYPYLKLFHNENNIRNNDLLIELNRDDEVFIFCAIKGG